MRAECSGCQAAVEIDTTNLGPQAALGLLDPKHVLCHDCVAAAGDEIRIDGGRRWLLHDGLEFRELGGAFVRSVNPAVRSMYYRDEHDRSGERRYSRI